MYKRQLPVRVAGDELGDPLAAVRAARRSWMSVLPHQLTPWDYLLAAFCPPGHGIMAVSYTHLDVYKRQHEDLVGVGCHRIREPLQGWAVVQVATGDDPRGSVALGELVEAVDRIALVEGTPASSAEVVQWLPECPGSGGAPVDQVKAWWSLQDRGGSSDDHGVLDTCLLYTSRCV